MRNSICSMALAAGLFVAPALFAQAPAGAPAGTTGICKDGTYSSAPSKSGACSGHKGVQTWYSATGTTAKPAAPASAPAALPAKPPTPLPAAAAPAPAPVPAPKPAPAPAAAAAPAKAGPAATAAAKTQAPGGGPGLVWVNTASNVYHCPGTTYYGKTKAGAYMTEAAAKAKGAHADANKPCAAS
jgi:Protein of unknown function (DUF3761)